PDNCCGVISAIIFLQLSELSNRDGLIGLSDAFRLRAAVATCLWHVPLVHRYAWPDAPQGRGYNIRATERGCELCDIIVPLGAIQLYCVWRVLTGAVATCLLGRRSFREGGRHV